MVVLMRPVSYTASLYVFCRHFSKSKNRRDVEGPWSPGVQAMPPSHGPLASQGPAHNMSLNARATRPLVSSVSCLCVKWTEVK